MDKFDLNLSNHIPLEANGCPREKSNMHGMFCFESRRTKEAEQGGELWADSGLE